MKSQLPLIAASIISKLAEARNCPPSSVTFVLRRLRPTDAVLDFGAGTGVLAIPLAAAGYRVTCIEPDTELRARLQASGMAAHASIDEIPSNSLDAVYTVNVLEHIADDLGAVAALRVRLKPGGCLIVYVPAFRLLYSSMDRQSSGHGLVVASC